MTTPSDPPRQRRQPDPPPRHRHPRRRRVLMWVGGVLATVIIALVGTAVGYYYHFSHQIHRVTGVIDSQPPTPSPIVRHDGTTAPPPAPAENILLVGSDTRTKNSGPYIPHTGGQACNCADTILIAHVPTGHKRAVVVSIPRDSWVDIPAYTDSKGHTTPEHMSKINSSLAEGGPALLVKTVQQLSGLHIDHYVQINFRAFVEMVNAVNGVTVCLTHHAQDHYSGIDLDAGVHHLNGITALEYVRQRHGLPDGDLDRIKRQQAVIQQIASKVVSKGILLHPIELTDVLDSVTSNVTVDSQLSTGDMIDLARTFAHFDAAHMEFATTPVTDEGATRDGQSVVLLDQQGTDTMFNDVARGYLPSDVRHTPTASPTAGATASPSPTTASPRPTVNGTPVPAGVKCLP